MNDPTTQTLFAVGFCLIMAGVFFRGFAASTRRDLARRKQHRLDDRKSGDASLNSDLDRPPGWIERNSGHIANTVLVSGVVIVAYAIFG